MAESSPSNFKSRYHLDVASHAVAALPRRCNIQTRPSGAFFCVCLIDWCIKSMRSSRKLEGRFFGQSLSRARLLVAAANTCDWIASARCPRTIANNSASFAASTGSRSSADTSALFNQWLSPGRLRICRIPSSLGTLCPPVVGCTHRALVRPHTALRTLRIR